MMYRLVILLLLLAPALVRGQSALPPMWELEANFEADSLSSENLREFETRARQKAKDLFDYIELLASIGNNQKLTGHTFRMIEKLFASDTCRVYSFEVPTESIDVGALTQKHSIPAYLYPDGTSYNPHQHDINLQPTGNGSYSGLLLYSFKPHDENANDSGPTHTLEVHLQRVSKQFGKEKRLVWEVYLCDVDAPWNRE